MKRALRTILPAPLVTRLRELLSLPPAGRAAYARLRLRSLAGAGALPPSLKRPCRVVFVCHGNIIRSAIAESALRHQAAQAGLAGVEAASAGVFAIDGRSADPRAAAAAAARGLSLNDHRARRLTRDIVDAADVLLVMDRLNEAEVASRFADAAPRLRLLGALLGGGDPAIADPFDATAADVDATCARIMEATAALVAVLAER